MHTAEVVPGQMSRCWVMPRRYIEVLSSLGALPCLTPLLSKDELTLRAVYEELDGLFLSGGSDVDPSCYNESKHVKCGATDSDRDAVESQLVRWAVGDRKPIMAVCRGLQMLNVAMGGTLYQDVPSQRPGSVVHDSLQSDDDGVSRDYVMHDVRVETNTRLGNSLATDRVMVNSMHHQAIKHLGTGLVATAWAADGLIEAAECTDGHYVIGVQWHPEDMTQIDGQRRLFTEFLDAARGS
jgi:putative glutamine amidotransferase